MPTLYEIADRALPPEAEWLGGSERAAWIRGFLRTVENPPEPTPLVMLVYPILLKAVEVGVREARSLPSAHAALRRVNDAAVWAFDEFDRAVDDETPPFARLIGIDKEYDRGHE